MSAVVSVASPKFDHLVAGPERERPRRVDADAADVALDRRR